MLQNITVTFGNILLLAESRDLGYSGIMKKLFIANQKTYEFKDMEEVNKKLDLPKGAWFEHEDDDSIPEGTHVWRLGNFFD